MRLPWAIAIVAAASIAAGPFVAGARGPERVYRVGVLGATSAAAYVVQVVPQAVLVRADKIIE